MVYAVIPACRHVRQKDHDPRSNWATESDPQEQQQGVGIVSIIAIMVRVS